MNITSVVTCQRIGSITKRHELPLQGIIEVEIFNCWGMDFVGPLPMSHSHEYILVVVDYVSKKSVEAVVVRKVDVIILIKFHKRNIFCRFGTLIVLKSDRGSHFCNEQLKHMLKHYSVRHKVGIAYHQQTNS